MVSIGYFGILIPEMNFWQGYFLDDRNSVMGETYLAATRRTMDTLVAAGADVGWHHAVQGVKPEDRLVFGTLVNTLVEGAVTSNSTVIASASAALHHLGSGNYFLVNAKRHENGFLSSFARMPDTISTPDQARDYIHSLPEVAAMARRTLYEVHKHPRRKH